MIPVAELELEDVNGVIYPLEFPGRHVMSSSGLGMPPIQHWTTRSPMQHGRTHWGYAFQQRIVNLVFYSKGCSRTGMFQHRAANIEMLSPINGPHILRLTYPNGQAYELHDVWYNTDYGLSSDDQTFNSQIGGVQLVVNDPFYKWATPELDAGESLDADGRICVAVSTFTLAPALVLPFVAPYLLGTTTATATLNCTNDGSWETLPIITIDGPVNDWRLDNPATGDYLNWDGYQIANGETVTIDIQDKTVTSSLIGEASAYLSGNTGSFSLVPGLNALTFFASGGVVNLTTTLSVCWYVQVLGT